MIANSENALIDDAIEVAILRSMIDEPVAARIACERLTGLSFGVHRRGLLFVILRKMNAAGRIDELSIPGKIAALKNADERQLVQDSLDETCTTGALGSAHNIEIHCARMIELAARREAQRKAQDLQTKALDFTADIAREFTQSAAKVEKQQGRNIVTGTFDALANELADAKTGKRYAVP